MSSLTVKGIVSFPNIFQAKVAQGATEAKFGISILLPPTDPQVQTIQTMVNQAKAEVPTGYNGADECFGPYDTKYAGKEYYDQRFSGWWVLSCSAKESDRPTVVDMNFNDIVDPGKVFAGMVAHVHMGISYYSKGKGGIGGWLNGVMITEEEPPMGRLDNKPTAEQMFGGVSSQTTAPAVQQQSAPVNTPPPAPTATAPSAPAAPAAKVMTAKVMTAKAAGATYESFVENGWTDEQMIAEGYLTPPTSF